MLIYSCRSYMYMLLHLVANWIHWRSYQYLYKVWIEYELRETTLDHELIVILNRWELLLGHVGIWDVWEKCQLVNHCLGAITVPWSLLNSPLTPIVAVCSLTQNLLLTLISLKRNATRKNSKFFFWSILQHCLWTILKLIPKLTIVVLGVHYEPLNSN